MLLTMEISKQSQKAGDNSTQMQAGTINNYYTTVTGIDESRARAICQEEYAIAQQNWTSEAVTIADNRVHQLEEKLIPKMKAYDNSFKFFADPAFQVTLRHAQITAASSERESDFDMLSDLLLHRLEQKDDMQRRLGICKAIEVVDKISDEALIALSIVYAIQKFVPTSYDLQEGLSTLDNLYGTLLDSHQLPKTTDWLEHLDLLSAIRLGIKGINSFKKIEEYMPQHLSQYLISGVEDNSEELNSIKSEFVQCGISISCLVPHPLKPNFIMLKTLLDVEQIIITKHINGSIIRSPLDAKQKEIMNRAISVLRKDESTNSVMRDNLMKEWNKFPNLKIVKDWWDTLPCSFTITPVGAALANAYAHGKEPNVPSLY